MLCEAVTLSCPSNWSLVSPPTSLLAASPSISNIFDIFTRFPTNEERDRLEGEHCIQTHHGRIKHGFSCSPTLPADTPLLSYTRLWLGLNHNKRGEKERDALCLHGVSLEHPAAAEDAPLLPASAASGRRHPTAPHLPPLPCARPSRCNKAASTSFTLRERASRLWSTDNRCATTTAAARPAVVLLCVGRSLLRPTQLPPAWWLHVSAALLSREPLPTNGGAEPVRGRDRPANQQHCPAN